MKNTVPSAKVRSAFANAVMARKSTAMLIDKDNHEAGWLRVDDAVERDACFAVAVGEQVLAVDCDNGDLAAVDELCACIEARGAHPVVFASGRPSHRHVFAAVEDDATRELLAKEAKRLGFDLRSGARRIRPPFARHRCGGRSRLLVPSSPRKALEMLTIPDPRCPLSPRMNVLL